MWWSWFVFGVEDIENEWGITVLVYGALRAFPGPQLGNLFSTTSSVVSIRPHWHQLCKDIGSIFSEQEPRAEQAAGSVPMQGKACAGRLFQLSVHVWEIRSAFVRHIIL